jgi:hypothetical protein
MKWCSRITGLAEDPHYISTPQQMSMPTAFGWLHIEADLQTVEDMGQGISFLLAAVLLVIFVNVSRLQFAGKPIIRNIVS